MVATSWPSLSTMSRTFRSLEASFRAVASWVFAQPVGRGRLIWFLLIHSLICSLVHSTNIFKARYGARPLLGTGPSHSSFLFSPPQIPHVGPSPVPGCLLHSAFPSLTCVSQKGRGFAVEINSSEIFQGNIKVFPHCLWPGLVSAPRLLSGPSTSCPLE